MFNIISDRTTTRAESVRIADKQITGPECHYRIIALEEKVCELVVVIYRDGKLRQVVIHKTAIDEQLQTEFLAELILHISYAGSRISFWECTVTKSDNQSITVSDWSDFDYDSPRHTTLFAGTNVQAVVDIKQRFVDELKTMQFGIEFYDQMVLDLKDALGVHK